MAATMSLSAIFAHILPSFRFRYRWLLSICSSKLWHLISNRVFITTPPFIKGGVFFANSDRKNAPQNAGASEIITATQSPSSTPQYHPPKSLNKASLWFRSCRGPSGCAANAAGCLCQLDGFTAVPHRFARNPHTYRSSDTGMVFVMMLVRRQYLAET